MTSISEETRRKLRETRQATLGSGLSAEEAHADLPELPPLPKEEGEVVVMGVQKGEKPPE